LGVAADSRENLLAVVVVGVEDERFLVHRHGLGSVAGAQQRLAQAVVTVPRAGKKLDVDPEELDRLVDHVALQKGVADATFSPSEVLKGWKQAEVVKSTTQCYSVGYTAGFFVVMNLDKWNSLPRDVQAVIEQINKEWVAKYGDAWEKSDVEGLEFSRGLGNEVIELSKEENARWADAVAPVVDEYIKAATEKGLPGKEYVEFIRAKISEYSK